LQQAFGIERPRILGAERVEALPTALIENIAIIDASNRNVVTIHGGITEGSIVNQDDLVTPFAFVGEDVFQCAQVNEVGDIGVDFFTDLARDRFRAALAGDCYRRPEGS